jgi:acyl carrier protein
MEREAACTPECLSPIKRSHPEAMAYRIPLPTYAFQRTRHWLEEKRNSSAKEKLPTSSSQGDIVQEMLSLWKKYLGTEEIEMEDNFFEKGGTSLIATSLISGIQKHFQIEMELKDLFEDPTIKGSVDFVMNQTLLALEDKDLNSLIGTLRE